MCVPVVSVLIERLHDGEKQLLVQTRWKPERDPVYSGTMEIPAGWVDKYENIYDALKREVREETGLDIIKITPDNKTEIMGEKDDGAFAFETFCCQQQVKGGLPWVGFVFLCEVEDKEPEPQEEEVRDIRWMPIGELKDLVESKPDEIFTLQLPVLQFYLNYIHERTT